MSEKTTKKKLPKRLENFIKGLFMVLFAVILGINAGKIARTLVFLPLYLLGAYYYILISLLGINGLFRMFAGKKLKIKSVLINLGIASLFVFAFFLVCYITNNNMPFNFENDIVTNLDLYNGQLGTFYSEIIILPFNNGSLWGSGLIGLLLSQFIANNNIILGIAIIFAVLALILLLIKPIIAIVKKISSSKKEKKEKKEKAPKPDKKMKIRKEPKEKKEKEKRFKKHKKDDEDEDKKDNSYPEITPISVEKEEIKEDEFVAQYGFEHQETRAQGTDYEQETISLDEAYSSRVIKQNEYSEFTELSFEDNPEVPLTHLPEENDSNIFSNASKEDINSYVKEVVHNEDRAVETPITSEPIIDEPIEDDEEEMDPSLDNFDKEEQPVSIEKVDFLDSVYEEPIKEEKVEESIVKEENKPIENKEEIEKIFEKKIVVDSVPSDKVEEQKREEPPKKRQRVEWVPPSSELLEVVETAQALETNAKDAEGKMVLINDILNNFKVGARCTSYTIGSSVTRFNIEYDANVSVKSVERLVSDISLRLGGVNARFTPIVQGESYSGLEIPNAVTTTVGFKEIFESLPPVNKHPLSVGFGKDISGKVIAADFDEFPHLLVAGTTGSGKSIYIHSIIATLIMRVSPDDLKIVLVDPKKVEMTKYRDMPHLLCPIITEAPRAKVMMSKLVDEMNNRYELFAVADSCSNIKQYNEYAKEHGVDPMPYIIAVLDEYADLVDTCKEISQPVVSIAQKARAAGIHMLISTQRPSTNVITGVIKGNLPTHVALMTSSYTDSMTILGEGGAEKLLGKGDMLVQSPLVSRVGVTRLQGCYVQNKEIGRIVGYLKEHYETVYDPNYLDLVDHSQDEAESLITSGEVEKEVNSADEEKYQSIKEWVMTQQFVSMSKIQRECGVGFNRAGKIFSRLQREGIVSTQQDGATKGCKVLKHGDDDDDGDYVVTSDELIS